MKYELNDNIRELDKNVFCSHQSKHCSNKKNLMDRVDIELRIGSSNLIFSMVRYVVFTY